MAYIHAKDKVDAFPSAHQGLQYMAEFTIKKRITH